MSDPGGGKDPLGVIDVKLQSLNQSYARLEGQLERLEVKMDNRLDRLQFVDKVLYQSEKEGIDKRLENHFALIMTIMGLQITMILAFIGYLVVAA